MQLGKRLAIARPDGKRPPGPAVPLLLWLLLLPGQQLCAEAADTNVQLDEAKAFYRERNYADTLSLLRPLAESGDAQSQTILALLYRLGEGVRRDPQQAVNWYRQAALQGYAPAEYSLGVMLDEGIGTEVDLKEAEFWLDAAARQGHERAAVRLAQLRSARMATEPSIQEQQWSRDWNLSLPPAQPAASEGQPRVATEATSGDQPATSEARPPTATETASRSEAQHRSPENPVIYQAQLGAMSSHLGARNLWELLSREFGSFPGRRISFVAGADSLVRVFIGDFPAPEPVRDFCRGLLSRGLESGCLPVPVVSPAHEAAMTASNPAYAEKIRNLHLRLGIPEAFMRTTRLPLQPESPYLQDAGADLFGRRQLMDRNALAAWRRMKEAAAAESVVLLLISAFRSPEYQTSLIEGKLNRGQLIEDILRVNAAPGYSEHHTGRALDLGTENSPHLEEAFEETEAFRWLTRRAGDFGFVMSFPRDNPYGIIYEPWHWTYGAGPATGN